MGLQSWLSKVSNSTVIGALFGTSIYFYRNEFSRLSENFRHENYFRFSILLMGLTAAGAVSEIIREYITGQQKSKIKYIRTSDGRVEIEGEEDKIIEIIKSQNGAQGQIVPVVKNLTN